MSDSVTSHLAPSASQILIKAGEETGIPREQVERVLTEANVVLKTPVVADRRICLLNMTATGTKNGSEPFTVRQRFGPGVWAIAHPANSAGKTSLLEFLVLPLRGAARDLPRDVRSWIHHVRLDLTVAGQPVRIVIDASAGWERTVQATIFSADTVEELVGAEDDQLRRRSEAVGLSEIERVIGEFMLDALRMERTHVWQGSGGADGEGTSQLHGWKAYFGACYLNPGGDELLLGDVNVSGLPGRLLELFVDLPYSTPLTELTVASRRVQKIQAQDRRRAEGDARARATDRERWQHELDEVEEKVATLRAAATIDTSELVRAVEETANILQQDRENLDRIAQALLDSRDVRIRAEQAKMDADETWQARRVLGRLDPICCPRCDEPITSERRISERERAMCAVCTRPLPEVDQETAEALLRQFDNDLTDARQAEQKIIDQHNEIQQQVERSYAAYETARKELQTTLTTDHSLSRVNDLEVAAAELRGRLAATSPSTPTQTEATTSNADVLEAVRNEVYATVDKAGKQLLPDLDTEIIALCKRFGVQNLDSVKLTRAAQVNAVKAGQRMRFKDLSRGDRLRMRIATVIALLRVGAARGVTSHPGLLLIDSIAAEELTDDAARTLVAELQAVADELTNLQVVFTTANPELVTDLVPAERVITAEGEHLF